MKRDAGVNAVFFLSKKTAFTPASVFIFGRPTDVMALDELSIRLWFWFGFCKGDNSVIHCKTLAQLPKNSEEEVR